MNETRARDFRIGNMVLHVDYNPITYENDIAIIRIERPTLFNTYIWPVCMPPLNEDWTGRNVIVLGWGTLKFSGPHSKILMEVRLIRITELNSFTQYIQLRLPLCRPACPFGSNRTAKLPLWIMCRIRRSALACRRADRIAVRAIAVVRCSSSCPIDAGSPLALSPGAWAVANQSVQASTRASIATWNGSYPMRIYKMISN